MPACRCSCAAVAEMGARGPLKVGRRISVRVDLATLTRIKIMSAAEGLSIAALVRDVLRQGLQARAADHATEGTENESHTS